MFLGILIIRAPASGKTTLCKAIAGIYPDIAWVSAGELVRQNAKINSDLKKCIDKGKLIDSHIMSSLLSNQINKIKLKYQYTIIDGFPRDIRNLAAWRSAIAVNNYTIGLFTVITCDESIVLKRMTERLGRSDDANADAVKERVRIFYSDTNNMLKHSLLPNEKVIYIASQKKTEDTRLLFRKVIDGYMSNNKN